MEVSMPWSAAILVVGVWVTLFSVAAFVVEDGQSGWAFLFGLLGLVAAAFGVYHLAQGLEKLLA